MGFISRFDPAVLKSLLRISNYWADKNRNQYPIIMRNTLNSLYDYIPCPCDDQCQCKLYGCTNHYVRKANIPFVDAKSHFLSNYVDAKSRAATSSGKKDGRGKKAIEVIDNYQKHWNSLPRPLTTHLVCTDWCDNDWQTLAKSFKATPDTIYRAKWLSLLALDTFVAYDTKSILLLNRDYRGETYFDLLSNIRSDLLNHLQVYGVTLQLFRFYDKPSEFFTGIPVQHPQAIGNILDKLFLTL
jgi:hypothetical protein